MNRSLVNLGRKYAAVQWKYYLGGTIALILTNIIVLEIPQLAKQVINAVAKGSNLEPYSLLTLGIIGLGLAQVIIRTTSRILIFWPGRTLEAALKNDLFAHILRVPSSILSNFSIGDLTSRLNNDVTQLRIFYAFGVLQVLNVIFISGFTVSKMASINLTLTALTIAPMLLMLIVTKTMMPRMYQATKENTEALGRLTGRVAEAFSQIHIIQTMNIVDTMLSRTQPDNEAIFNSNLRTIKIRTFLWPVMTILIGLSQFATLAYGGQQIIAGNLTVGDIMAFNIYISMLTFPFVSLGIILNVYQRAKPAAERLQEVTALITEPGFDDNFLDTSAKSATRAPALEVRELSYTWPDGRKVLDHISFSVMPGERVGIFGVIGSGKSTLFNVITRLHEHQNGEIYVDGVNTKSLSPETVRSKIAYGLQQPLLFSESVKSNLSLGLDEAKIHQDQLTRAAQIAQVYDDITRLPESWDTLIGEKGIKLSGGQKQRLSLARLLMRPADIIILDDVLSAVDHDTEHRLISSLLATKAALIIASHRTSILEPCDKVLVLKSGKIIASGPFNAVKHVIELVENDPEISRDEHQESES